MEEKVRLRIGTVLNDNGVDILSEDGGSLLHDLYRIVEQELDRAREEGIKTVEEMKYKGDMDKFKHIKTTFDCKTTEEYIWFIRGMTLNDVIARLKSKLTTK